MARKDQLLSGEEPLGDATVRDFWAWALSVTLDNVTRGMLAEYLVAHALGADASPRMAWDTCDVRTSDGLRVEVKAAGRTQAWEQAAPSRIVFRGLKARAWAPLTGYAHEQTYNADVYVFCVHDGPDPLDVSSWSFWILPRDVVARTGSASVSLSTVQVMAAQDGLTAGFDALAVAVARMRARQASRHPARDERPGVLDAAPSRTTTDSE